jgi:thiol-disulfide isomerase/thioredoxin
VASSPERGTVFPLQSLRTGTGTAPPLPDSETLYAFFHTDCPTSEMTIPFLDRLQEIGDGRGLRVVAVSQDDPATTEAFVSRLGLTVPVLYDPPPWSASESLGLASVPAFAAVSRDGRLERTVIGLQKLELEAFAERAAALAGRPSRPFFRPEENVPAIRPG